MYILYFVIISPWKIPLTQVPKLVEIGSVVLEKKKMGKNHYNDNNADINDDDGQRTNYDQKTSLEPSAQLT